MKTSKHCNYVKLYLLLLFFFAIPIFINYFFLRNSGEFLSFQEIFLRQSSSGNKNFIYGSAVFNGFKELKLYAVKMRKPEIISFGSSRVLQFRESFFSKPFYNLGSTASSIQEALNTSNLMLEQYLPKVVLLGVDFWWFSETLHKPSYGLSMRRELNKVDPGHLLLPFHWLKDGRISIEDYFRFVRLIEKPHIGVKGKLHLSGIGSDGSYYYTDIVTGRVSPGEGGNAEKFQCNTTASEVHFEKFLELIKLFQDNNVEVILFLPPLSQDVNKEMKKYNYICVENLKDKFKKHGIRIYDFTQPARILSTDDCEFIDGIHGGDVLYAKVLNYISSKEPVLKEYVRHDYLYNVIEKYSGLAMLPDSGITSKKEVDFLHKNCKKGSF